MIAVTLLQHGADTTIKNNNGKKVFKRSLVKKLYRTLKGLTGSSRILQQKKNILKDRNLSKILQLE